MPSKRVDHYGPGFFGRYKGYSIHHESGRIDHYRADGGIIPVVKYAGYSQVESSQSGEGGGEFPLGATGFVLLILSPILLVLGAAALCICPGLWLVRRSLRRKPAEADPNERTKFVGFWWVVLASFMLVLGLTALGDTLVLISAALNSATPTGIRYGGLIVLVITASWAGSLGLGAIDILRKNRIGRILGVFAAIAGLAVMGHFLRQMNTPVTRTPEPIATDSAEAGSANADEKTISARHKVDVPAAAIAESPKDSAIQAKDVPEISSVGVILPQQQQTITIHGSGFGTRAPYIGDSEFIRLTDVSDDWNAGSSKNSPPDQVTLSIASWTDSEIVITGFSGAYGNSPYVLRPLKEIHFEVWNAQTGAGPAEFSAGVADAKPN
jgi:hypothetical protein